MEVSQVASKKFNLDLPRFPSKESALVGEASLEIFIQVEL